MFSSLRTAAVRWEMSSCQCVISHSADLRKTYKSPERCTVLIQISRYYLTKVNDDIGVILPNISPSTLRTRQLGVQSVSLRLFWFLRKWPRFNSDWHPYHLCACGIILTANSSGLSWLLLVLDENRLADEMCGHSGRCFSTPIMSHIWSGDA